PDPVSIHIWGASAVYVSSAANDYYGPLGPFTEWDLPEGLGGYLNLPETRMYYPPNPLRTGSAKRVSEADAIDYVTRSIFDVVGSVFSFNCGNYQVDEQSESTHSVTLSLNGSLVEHVSRVDKSWSVAYG